MWKSLWQKWTIDKPAALGDWLWDVFVVQFAAYLDRLTWRQVIAVIPAAILVLAYAHQIPVHPGLMLVGDLLAYIDIFSVLFLLGVLSRVATIWFVMRQAAARAATLIGSIVEKGMDFRHRREGGARQRKRSTRHARNDDDPAAIAGVAWA